MLGVLWFDNSDKAIHVKIQEGIDFCRKKYNIIPTHALVHPNTLESSGLIPKDIEEFVDIRIDVSTSVQANHFYIGIKDG